MIRILVLLVSLVLISSATLAQLRTVQSDGWEISWDDSMGVATRGVTDSNDVERWANKVVLYGEPQLLDCEEAFSGRVLSIVGALVSFETSYSFYCEGAASPRAITRFQTIDLRTGQEVDIRLLVPDSVLVAALKQNKVIREALEQPSSWIGEVDIEDFPDLYSIIEWGGGGCEIGFGDLGTSFAFHHRRGDQIAVKFGLSHGCEVMGGRLTQVGVYLPIPAILAAGLAHAEAQGYLMADLTGEPKDIICSPEETPQW